MLHWGLILTGILIFSLRAPPILNRGYTYQKNATQSILSVTKFNMLTCD